jgi:hypothetical protein
MESKIHLLYKYLEQYFLSIFGVSFFFCRSKQANLFSVMGSMYGAVLFIGVNNASTVQPVVAIERTIFYRERAAGMYSAIPYAIAQVNFLYYLFLSHKHLLTILHVAR